MDKPPGTAEEKQKLVNGDGRDNDSETVVWAEEEEGRRKISPRAARFGAFRSDRNSALIGWAAREEERRHWVIYLASRVSIAREIASSPGTFIVPVYLYSSNSTTDIGCLAL